ncbi:class I adenylate-forming enzyme family protein [Pseudoteredinibacter isoporae]|uniref:Acyl-CoA synthetase (AMP-forming)/AMP-acid ligase II n=1 Tax=Pseudoteredinibacter isoporae TaxID=570281 RepID=A0A7X0JQS7_9GAMM|nr:class I adenylate-forming enzyme family protein [Pseudoteredinibacter isoporae]MBB6520535.1 acyl-CoA synthetase (AMP-forming)/AMP-acid ligase II [Pseudoteredinibacter isoporae]NHO86102.1 acyl--CoA ligase [Pseudoteredinibacter isoporae]NIB25447.1 acyl--CoA ligase [Pseudoteredinibacter isoporae]
MITTPQPLRQYYREQGFFAERKLHDLLYQTAVQKPGAVALVDPLNRQDLTGQDAVSLSYQELHDSIEQYSYGLMRAGLKKDDIVFVQLPNIVELVILYMACSRLGAIVSPVPMQYQKHELADILPILQPKIVVSLNTFKGKDQSSPMWHAIEHCHLQLDEKPAHFTIGNGQAEHGEPFDRLLEEPIDETLWRQYLADYPANADDIVTICWTSGTEGKPKGIPRSHNQWLTIGLATYEGNKLQDGEALLNPFPFINMASIGGLMMSWLYSAGKMVLHHPMDLAVFVQQLISEDISYTLAPPPLLNNIIKHPEMLPPNTLAKVHTIGSGSAPLDAWMVEGFKQQHNIEIVNHFGSNEGVSMVCGPDDTQHPEQRARLFPISNKLLETRLANPESCEIINEPGVSGELQIKGPAVFDGYYKAPQKTQQAFTTDGYFKTGDLFEIADADFYRFVGRCKDLIIRGGVNIAPAELDNLLGAHPAVEEAAAAGYPCDTMGERVAAFVVLKDDQELSLEALCEYLKERQIAMYKLPEKLVLLDAIPRNPLGKALRYKLSEMVS